MSVLVRAVAALLACFAVAASAKDAASGQLEIVTLSNRADLISGGDALVEVRVPRSVAPSQVRLSLNGHDVTAMFRVDSTAGVMRGVLTGMVPGRNDFLADSKGRRASLTITNHAIGGPVLLGSQTTPWICATPTPVAESSIARPPRVARARCRTRARPLRHRPTTASSRTRPAARPPIWR
ncbi:MAG: hypothetical protein E6H40_18470 [Betaproteobacteria bacterium]|nr:MAG: hypothetical protein E6H40_18470 [Betaproteobacteria bacterium]